MNFQKFIQDKGHIILLNFCCAVLFVIFLYLTGTKPDELILVLAAWTIILCCWLIFTYQKQKQKLMNLHRILNRLDKKYLLLEMIQKPTSYLEQEYYIILQQILKSMTEHVSQTERKMLTYQHFIEQWVHEVKRPVTVVKLLCENHKNESTKKICFQMEELERYIEQVLYYARLGHVEKDYIISETTLNEIVEEALSKNKLLLIQNDVLIHMQNLQYTVYTDKKWIVFILNQILINCVQYKKETLEITFSALLKKDCMKLMIKDNGIGIRESELSRIFQLGFTGSNGRSTNSSTGIGLYLCYKLCKKLGIHICASSSLNEFTEITLTFPINQTVELQKQGLSQNKF